MTDQQSSTEVVNDDKDLTRTDPNIALNRDADFSTAPVLNDDGSVILSQDIRDEQEREGYVADIQPKSVPLGNVGLEGGGWNAPNGYGAMQATGNLAVNSAVAAAYDDQAPVAQDVAANVEQAKDAADAQVVVPGTGTVTQVPNVVADTRGTTSAPAVSTPPSKENDNS